MFSVFESNIGHYPGCLHGRVHVAGFEVRQYITGPVGAYVLSVLGHKRMAVGVADNPDKCVLRQALGRFGKGRW
jgi:hypothetical protein